MTTQRKRLCCAAFESETEMNFFDVLVGLSEEAALETVRQTKHHVRVVERDGEEVKGNKDIILDRVNLFVAHDTVYKVTLG